MALAQALQLDTVLVPALKVPAAHTVHTPSVPSVTASPATYAVLMRCPGGQEVTAEARTVLAVTVHALVTYCEPFGVEQFEQLAAPAAL